MLVLRLHTKATRRYAPVRNYVDILKTEISHVASTLQTKPIVTHIHWGGGTPTILTAEDFAVVMDLLRRKFVFSDDAVTAVEVDPRVRAPEMLDAMASQGVTRVSVGVQDFNAHVQLAVNRVQPFEQVADAVAALRQAGISQINFDLMYGLPSQTVADVRRTLELAVSLRPNRVAAFGYAHVPWMKTHQKMIYEASLPNAEERMEQARVIAEYMCVRGYRRIGLDHFACDDDPLALSLDKGGLRRNFQGYTTDQEESVLGFGASAISTLREGYAQNHSDYGRYAQAIEVGGLATVRGIELDDDDRRRRAIIERLMCTLQVDLDRRDDDIDTNTFSFADELETLRSQFDESLVEINGRRITVTELGRPWVRLVCAVFDRYLPQDNARHSVAI
ncbi:MAG: oxygen-independent coproporphyrinogen-3 oxidase [Alphaproteobacteria bacterium]|jgi:oxygen-independent coproporphyrinogen-3 oxidase